MMLADLMRAGESFQMRSNFQACIVAPRSIRPPRLGRFADQGGVIADDMRSLTIEGPGQKGSRRATTTNRGLRKQNFRSLL